MHARTARRRLARERALHVALSPETAAWVALLDTDLEAAQAALRCPPGERPTPPGGVASEPAGEEWFPGELSGDVEPAEPSTGLGPARPPKAATLASSKPLRGAYARRARGQDG